VRWDGPAGVIPPVAGVAAGESRFWYRRLTMKKPFILLLVVFGIVALLIYYKQNDTVVRMGVNTEIVEINDRDKTMIVSYEDEHNDANLKFKVDCNMAINKHQILYCDYQTQMVRELSFDSLRVGDDLILSMDDTEFLQLQNDGVIQALQIQLATQRLE
jgi:hypothetical protein